MAKSDSAESGCQSDIVLSRVPQADAQRRLSILASNRRGYYRRKRRFPGYAAWLKAKQRKPWLSYGTWRKARWRRKKRAQKKCQHATSKGN